MQNKKGFKNFSNNKPIIFNICRLKRSCVSVYHQKFGEKEKEQDELLDCKTIQDLSKKRHLEIWISILNVPGAISNGFGDHVVAPFLYLKIYFDLL